MKRSDESIFQLIYIHVEQYEKNKFLYKIPKVGFHPCCVCRYHLPAKCVVVSGSRRLAHGQCVTNFRWHLAGTHAINNNTELEEGVPNPPREKTIWRFNPQPKHAISQIVWTCHSDFAYCKITLVFVST